ncbi:MAG TPA: hypothetical protein VH482_18225 [Thermomicrobiales bacterium]|jgi:hypothetical protein
MDEARFETLAKMFATGGSRRSILRGVTAAAAGTILALAGQDALAARCRPPGRRCRADARAVRAGLACCTGDCDPDTHRCPCPEGQHYCARARTCATCCADADCGEGESCRDGTCQPLLGDVICGTHEMSCYVTNGDGTLDATWLSSLGKHEFNYLPLHLACRPKDNCETLNDQCRAQNPDACSTDPSNCFAAPDLCNPFACPSCFWGSGFPPRVCSGNLNLDFCS